MVPGSSCGVVYVILRLAISIEHRLVTHTHTHTHTHTTTAYITLAWRRWVKILVIYPHGSIMIHKVGAIPDT